MKLIYFLNRVENNGLGFWISGIKVLKKKKVRKRDYFSNFAYISQYVHCQ